MNPQDWGDGPLVYVGTYLYAVISGLVPVVNVEVFLLAMAALRKGDPLAVILLTTAGQMTAKYVLYMSGRGLIRLPPGRMQGKVEKARKALDEHPSGAGSVVLFSAVTGVPPFYGMSLAAGALAMPLWHFMGISTLGRLFRFSLVYFAPHLLRLAF
jgi:membrane protein YqaA with SNARE-associated domain